MFYNLLVIIMYDWGGAFLYALIIILLVFGLIGYFVLYYHCAFIVVSDMPGYCLSVL